MPITLEQQLIHTHVLATVPVEGWAAVYIPKAEIPARMHELPARGCELKVIGEGLSDRPCVLVTPDQVSESAANSTYRLWRPNELVEEIVQTRNGRVLDLACGCGRDAVFLAAQGFEVTAVDHLPDALNLGKGLQERYAAGGIPIDWKVADVKSFEPEGAFDVILMFFYLDRQLLRRAAEWLRPGGMILVETFTEVNRERNGKPSSPSLALAPGELPELLSGLEVKRHEEAWRGSKHTARFAGIRPQERRPL